MPAKNLQRIDEEGLFLHIYNKGVEKRIIFNNEEDYKVFLDYLNDYLTVPKDPESTKKTFQVHGRTFRGIPHLPKNYFNKVELIAYSLLPDHFHLLLHQKVKGSLESFIRSLCTRYSIYFNKKYARTGALFEGPYKSVQIKDETQLLHLTRYLHQGVDYSSYPEYLDSRKTPWVKPEVVLSFLNRGTGGYKDFVEKHQPDQKELELIDGLAFDSKTGHHERILETPLERRHPASSKEIRTNQDLKIRSRMPEFLAISTLVFVVLVGFSLWNINYVTARSYQPLPSPEVLSETQETILEATPSATPEATATAEIKPEAKPETTLTVKIGDGSSFVNIRQKPTINSDKIGKANNGDSFGLISFNSGWYEIKLADGSTGFISKKYAVINEGNN